MHPVEYLSAKMTSAECNYGIGDKALLAIVACLEKLHMYFHGIECTIFIDYHNLQNFATKTLLNWRQARWAGLLAQYQFHIQFCPGKANSKSNALTRRSRDLPCEGDGFGRPTQALLPLRNIRGFLDLEPKPMPKPGPGTELEPIPTPIPSTMFINCAILCISTIKYNVNI